MYVYIYVCIQIQAVRLHGPGEGASVKMMTTSPQDDYESFFLKVSKQESKQVSK